MIKEDHTISIIKDNISGNIWSFPLLSIAVYGMPKVSHKNNVTEHYHIPDKYQNNWSWRQMTEMKKESWLMTCHFSNSILENTETLKNKIVLLIYHKK